MIWPSNHSIYTTRSAHSQDHQHITKYNHGYQHITKYTQHTTIYATHTQTLSPLRVQLCLPATCPAQSDNWLRGSDGQEVMKSIYLFGLSFK